MTTRVDWTGRRRASGKNFVCLSEASERGKNMSEKDLHSFLMKIVSPKKPRRDGYEWWADFINWPDIDKNIIRNITTWL